MNTLIPGFLTVVKLGLYDEQGRLVRSILNEAKLVTGTHSYSMNKGGLAPGVYFLQMTSENGRLLVSKVAISE